MGKRTRITKGQLKRAVQGEMEQLLEEVVEAVETAPDGAIIAGSEEAVREAMARFRRLVYERAIALKAAAGEAAFSPSGGSDDGPSAPQQGAAAGDASDGERADRG